MLAQSTPPPTGDERVDLLARMGGSIVDALPLPDGSVLASEGSSLVLLNGLATPPAVLARVDLRYGMVLDLALSGSYLLALTEDGLLSLPLPARSIPAPLGLIPGGGQSLAVQGDLAVIAAREAGLRVIRVGADGSLALLTDFPLNVREGTVAEALDVTLSPDTARAFVAGESGILAVDLADPSAPHLIGPLSEIASAEAVTMVGALLAVASQGRVWAIDPSTGEALGIYAPIRSLSRIVVQDEFAYLADAADGLKILYLAAPDRPVQVYGESGRSAHDVWVSGDRLYLADAGGLRILDVSNRFRPLELGRVDLPGTPQAVTVDVQSARVFVALGEEGVAVVDVENLGSPQVTRRISLSGPALDVLYNDGILFAAAGDAGLAVLDAPAGGEALLTTFALPGPAHDLAQRGGALYIAAGEAGLLALDVTRPATPLLTGVLPLEPLRADSDIPPRQALAVTITGKRAYVSTGDGFMVGDVSHPDRPARLARIEAPADQVAIGGVYLYAVQDNRISVFDARATAEPIYLRAYTGPSLIAHLEVSGDFVFATHEESGPDLVALDFSAPDFPIETDNEGESGQTSRVAISASSVWLSAGSSGLRRYELTESGALIPRGWYLPVADSAVLAFDGSTLLAGGRSGWTVLAAEDSHLRASARSPDALSVLDLAVDGTTVAVAAGESGVALYDLATPDNPTLIVRRGTRGPAAAIALDEAFIYAADAGGLSIFDRRYLQPVAQITTPAPATDVALLSGFAYLSLIDGSLAVIDLAEPTGGIAIRRSIETRRPTDLIATPDGQMYGLADNVVMRFRTNDLDHLAILEENTLPQIAESGFFVGGLLAALTPSDMLRFYNVSALATGVGWQGAIDLTAIQPGAVDVAPNGRVAYVAYAEGGLGLVDATAPAIGAIFFHEEVRSLLLTGHTLFVLGTSLTAWDVSDPEAPLLLSTLHLPAPGRALDLALDGRLLLSLEDGFSVVAWDGASLAEASHLVFGSADRAVVIGSRAYIARHDGGLLVADVSDPSQPVTLFVYTSSSGQFVRDLLAWDGSTLLVSWEGGIDVLDVSAAAPAPHLVGITSTGAGRALGVSLSAVAPRGALALGADGVQLLDLADPAHPALLAAADTPGDSMAAALGDQTLFVADGSCGLRVLDSTTLAEVGVWRGSFASTVALGTDAIYVGGGDTLAALQFDPTAPTALPPVPQSPDPADGRADVPLNTPLSWGPPTNPCDPLTYDVYFGTEENPPFVGQVVGDPLLAVELAPLRTYYWRVDVTDRQGDRTGGPSWRFSTIPTTYGEALPPAPPVFAERLRQSPAAPLALIGAFLAAVVGLVLYRRTRRPYTEGSLPLETPDWYSTAGDDE